MKTLILVLTLVVMLSVLVNTVRAKVHTTTTTTTSIPTTTIPATGIEITKTADKSSVNLGEDITYTITVTNDGTSSIGEITVRDLLPEGIKFKETDTTHSLSNNQKEIFWNFPGLNVGQSIVIKLIGNYNKQVGNCLKNKAWVYIGPHAEGPEVEKAEADVGPHCNNNTAIPEFSSIVLPIALSVATFGVISLKRKF